MNLKELLYTLSMIGLFFGLAIISLYNVDSWAFVAKKIGTQTSKANSQAIANSQTLRTSLDLVLPSLLMPMSPIETYSPGNLFEVINGQANLYLNTGFVKLTTQRLKLKEQPSKWLEVFIYQMNNHLSAFSVFSVQRRSGAKPIKLTPYAYQSRNGLFFVHDHFYVEIIDSDETDSLIHAMHHLAQAFVNQKPAQTESIPELSLFPDSDLIPDSLALLSKGAFGFAGFENVFVAHYGSKDNPIMAFISRCLNQSEAVKRAAAYQEFLKEYGGEVVPISSRLLNAKLIRILDTFELVFTHSVFVAGVREAPSCEAAENLAKQLSANLSAAD